MNPEAISAIKKASALCKRSKEAILGASLQTLKNSPGEIFHEYSTYTFAINGDASFKNLSELNLNQNDLIKVRIKTKHNSWETKSAFSLHFGGNTNKLRLIEVNKQAVSETCQSLCPGLNEKDIIEVLELCKEEFAIIPELTTIKNLNGHSRLMTGDILQLGTAFQAQQQADTTASAIHLETVLITANGAKILTS